MTLKRRWRRWAGASLLGLAVVGVHLWLLHPPATDTAVRPTGTHPQTQPATVVLPSPQASATSPDRASDEPTSGPTSAPSAGAATSAAAAQAAASVPPRRPAARLPRPSSADPGASDRPRGVGVEPEGDGSDPPLAHAASDTAAASLAAPPRPSPGRVATAPGCPSVPQEQLPPSVNVRYSLDRGGIHGEGQLEWRHLPDRYQLKLEGRLPVMGTILLQRSEGRFDTCGLAPRRHSERRLGRSERALSFERQGDSNGAGTAIGEDRVRFSSRSQSLTLRPGTQDRLSWLVEMAGLLSAWPAPGPSKGDRIGMDVAAVGGDVQHWIFVVQSRSHEGQLHLARIPDEPFDTRADIWTDPQRGQWPVRVELKEPRGDPLVLRLTGWQPVGP